jgi:glycosyltransferase involved in cell wall biosynthesis
MGVAETAVSVDVFMVVRDEIDYIAETMRTVLGQTHPGLERVVVAVGGDDGTEQVCRRLAEDDPRLIVLRNESGSTPVGLNLALAACSATWVARVDGHCLLQPGHVAGLVEAAAESGAVCVGPIMHTRPSRRTAIASGIAAAMSSRLFTGGSRYRSSEAEGFVDTVTFAMYHRETLEAVGRFDERLARNQDDELHDRLHRNGHRIWITNRVQVDYFARPTLRRLWVQYRDYGVWRWRSHRLAGQRFRARHLAPVGVVAASIGLLAGMLRRPKAVLLLVPAAGAVEAGLRSEQRRRHLESRPGAGLAEALAGVTMALAYGIGLTVEIASDVALRRPPPPPGAAGLRPRPVVPDPARPVVGPRDQGSDPGP